MGTRWLQVPEAPEDYHWFRYRQAVQRNRDTAAGYSVLVVPPACNPAAGITSDQ